MADPTCILATFRTDRGERELLSEFFQDGVEVRYLEDVSDDERADWIRQADVIISFNFPREIQDEEVPLLEHAEFLQLASAGASHVPYDRLPESLVVASNVGAYAEPMAEHTMAMALALAKRLHINHGRLKRGDFNQRDVNVSLRGGVCGILGFGGIGKATARLMRGFDMEIHALNRSGTTDEPVEFIGTLDDLERVLRASDVVVVSLPLTVQTEGLISERELGWMKDAAILVNVARGAIIDEHALYEHLRAHPEFMAGIDTWWSEPRSHGEFRTETPILELPNILGSPHNSPFVPGFLVDALRQAAENAQRFLDGESIRGRVRREDYTFESG